MTLPRHEPMKEHPARLRSRRAFRLSCLVLALMMGSASQSRLARAESQGRDQNNTFSLLSSLPGEDYREAIRFAAKVTFFPYYAPLKLLTSVPHRDESSSDEAYRLLGEVGLPGLAYFGLFAISATPLEFYNNRILGISHDKLDQEKLFDNRGIGVVVGLNGVTPAERYYHAAEFMTGASKRDGKSVFQFNLDSPLDMQARMLEVYQKHGPIEKLIVAAHGDSGSLTIGGNAIKSMNWRGLPTDLFAKDAKIILISCSTAAGSIKEPDSGVNGLKRIFAPLLQQGGTIIASTRYVSPELTRIPLSYHDWSQTAGDHYLPIFVAAISTLRYPFLGPYGMFHKTRRIEVPSSVKNCLTNQLRPVSEN